MAEEAAEGGDADSYYDEEDAVSEKSSDDEEDQRRAEIEEVIDTVTDDLKNADATTNAETVAAGEEEEKKDGADDDSNEYDSDYDEEGRYIWGAEGEDWEFYYQEDKEAYERGESTVPEVLNPGALPTPAQHTVITSTATGAQVDTIIGVSMARDGAVYRTSKKKLKQSRMQEAAATNGAWKNY